MWRGPQKCVFSLHFIREYRAAPYWTLYPDAPTIDTDPATFRGGAAVDAAPARCHGGTISRHHEPRPQTEV